MPTTKSQPLNTVNFYGNVVDIRQAGKIQIIRLATATFSKDPDAQSEFFDIVAFERQASVIAELQAKLDARRAETGNEKSALTNVKLVTRTKPQSYKKDDGTWVNDMQYQLVQIVEPKIKAVQATDVADDEEVVEEVATEVADKEVVEKAVAESTDVDIDPEDLPF